MYKILGLGILSIALSTTDHRSDLLDGFRAGLGYLTTPIFVLADAPSRALESMTRWFANRSSMREEIDRLSREQLLLKAQIQKMAALATENERLRSLLGSAGKLEDNVLVAELIGTDPDPARLQVILDKGSDVGVFVGQPLLDAQGLMGQVIEVSPTSSRALLITDSSHSVPVQVNRNNIRIIAAGTGRVDELELLNVPNTADIIPGDLLVSSGLGRRFPVGYPVGTVTQVIHDPGKSFAIVKAYPAARLDQSRHVLLVYTEKDLASQR
jgi:rod shape-determining protein MreC